MTKQQEVGSGIGANDVAMGFTEWLAELRKLTVAAGVPNYIDQTGEECWLAMYDDGASPDEAWATECSYAAEDCV